jgi:hypothetical protein
MAHNVLGLATCAGVERSGTQTHVPKGKAQSAAALTRCYAQ